MLKTITKKNQAAVQLTLTKKKENEQFSLEFDDDGGISIPCLFIEGNTHYIDIDKFTSGVVAAITTSKETVFTFSQDFNGSQESLIQLFLIGRKIGEKELQLFLNPNQNFVFDKIERAISEIKGSDLPAMKNMMYKGLLSSTLEKVIEKTGKIEKVYEGKTLVVVDTHNLYHRYFHAIDEVTNSDGENVALVSAFRSFLPNVFNMNPDFVLFTDEGENIIRKGIYSEYKKKDEPRDSDLIKSIDCCNQIIEALGFKIDSSKDFEADDTIASYVKEFIKYGGTVIVFSTDKDLYQLIGPNVSLYNHFKRSFITEEQAKAKFKGVEVAQIRDALALQGDVSDNVPGVAGIGEATAAKLLKEYSNIEGIIENIPNLKKSKMKTNLEVGIAQLMMSRDLVTLHDCLAQDVNFEDLRVPKVLNLAPQKVIDIVSAAES